MMSNNKSPQVAIAARPLLDKLRRQADTTRLPSVARIVLNHGLLSLGASIAPPRYRGKAGACYVNSLKAGVLLTALDGEWRYCEGFAYQPRFDVAFPHAWLVDRQGCVMETTWPAGDAVYLGVVFDLTDVAEAMLTAPGSVLHDDWTRGMRRHEEHRPCCGPMVRECGAC